MAKNQSRKSPGHPPKKIWPCDLEFKRIYNKINELVKKGLSKEEILKMKI